MCHFYKEKQILTCKNRDEFTITDFLKAFLIYCLKVNIMLMVAEYAVSTSRR